MPSYLFAHEDVVFSGFAEDPNRLQDWSRCPGAGGSGSQVGAAVASPSPQSGLPD